MERRERRQLTQRRRLIFRSHARLAFSDGIGDTLTASRTPKIFAATRRLERHSWRVTGLPSSFGCSLTA